MRAVMLSINPVFCMKILNREKRLEFRTRIPKLELPYKCYIYCTQPHNYQERLWILNDRERRHTKPIAKMFGAKEVGGAFLGNGKVIAEFTCDYVLGHCEMANADIAEQQGKMKREDILKYSKGKEVFGLSIFDLRIYKEQNEITEFYKACNKPPFYDCAKCADYGEQTCFALKRPPQNWCYVERKEREK